MYLIFTSQTVWLLFLKCIFPHLWISKNKCYKNFSQVICESGNCISCLAFVWYFYVNGLGLRCFITVQLNPKYAESMLNSKFIWLSKDFLCALKIFLNLLLLSILSLYQFFMPLLVTLPQLVVLDCRWMFEDVETSAQFSSQKMRCNCILTWNRWATSLYQLCWVVVIELSDQK